MSTPIEVDKRDLMTIHPEVLSSEAPGKPTRERYSLEHPKGLLNLAIVPSGWRLVVRPFSGEEGHFRQLFRVLTRDGRVTEHGVELLRVEKDAGRGIRTITIYCPEGKLKKFFRFFFPEMLPGA